MALLTRKKTNEDSLGWRDDPTLKTGQAKIAVLEQKIATSGREISRAETAMYEAQQAFEDTLLNELLERGSAQDVEGARVAYHQAKETYDRLTAEKAPLDRARALLQKETAPLEDEAKWRVLARLMADYVVRVRELAALLTQAEAVNSEIDQIFRSMKDCAPEHEPWVAPEVNLAWPELRFNPNHDDGGKLGHWRKRAKEVLNGQAL